MATQDMIEFSEEEGEDDDVQAILAALQTRKEKQQKLKKNIRDRANKSQKQLKEESEAPDPVGINIVSRMRVCEKDLQDLAEKVSVLPAIAADTSKQENEELIAARRSLRELAKLSLQQSIEVETGFSQRLHKVSALMGSEARRSRNEDVIKVLTDMSQAVDQAIQSLKGSS